MVQSPSSDRTRVVTKKNIGMAKACRETVIDGYNLIHKLWHPGSGSAMAPFRERLEALLTAYRKATRRHVTIVYDGGSRPGASSESGAVDIVFSGTGANADRRIVDHIRQLGARAGVTTVVSSDLEIRQHVIAWGARWSSSESFAAELVNLGILAGTERRNPGKPDRSTDRKQGATPLDEREVERWLRLFGSGR